MITMLYPLRDKASNNIIFIYKSFYRQIINEELGSTSTYAKCTVEHQQLIRKHIDVIKLENLEPKPDWCNRPSFSGFLSYIRTFTATDS